MAEVTVRVQVWGPVEGASPGYSWLTIGVLENPEDFDLDSLKAKAVELVKKSEYRPATNMARLEFRKDGKVYMKAVFVDLWE